MGTALGKNAIQMPGIFFGLMAVVGLYVAFFSPSPGVLPILPRDAILDAIPMTLEPRQHPISETTRGIIDQMLAHGVRQGEKYKIEFAF